MTVLFQKKIVLKQFQWGNKVCTLNLFPDPSLLHTGSEGTLAGVMIAMEQGCLAQICSWGRVSTSRILHGERGGFFPSNYQRPCLF